MATIVGDVTGLQQFHHPQNMPHLVKKIKSGFYQKDIKNSVEGFQPPPPPPPPPVVLRWGYEFAYTSEGFFFLFFFFAPLRVTDKMIKRGGLLKSLN